MKHSVNTSAYRCLVLCLAANLLGCLQGLAQPTPTEIDPVAIGCEKWHRTHSFDDLRSCFLSVAHRREHRANVEAMLGPGERVTVAHKVWAPPIEAYEYTPIAKTNFHYVALYQNDIVVGICSYSLNSEGKPSVILP